MANEQVNYSVFRSAVDNNSNLQLIPFPDFNETIRFSGNSKTYQELVHTSRIKNTLNLPIDVLTSDSKTSRLAVRNEKKGTKVIPRPQNSWIIYRRDKYADPEFEGVKSSIASIKIGEKWKSESNEVLEYFTALSMLALEKHQKKYGGYKYQPKSRVNRKSKKSKDNQRRPKENVENISPETNNETTDLLQLVVTPSSPSTNEYPTPVSSITHSPVVSQNDFSDFAEETNNNSYFINPPTPPPSNQHSPVDHLLTNQDSFMNFDDLMNPNIDPMMYPNLSAIAPTNFSTYNNNSLVPDNFLEFLQGAEKLVAPQSSQSSLNTTTAYLDVNVICQDFPLFPENDLLMSDIILPTVESTIEEPTVEEPDRKSVV